MIDHDPPADRIIDSELAETIKSLPEERQLHLLKLLVDDMTAALLELIRKMSAEEQRLLLQQLQEKPDLSASQEETEIALRRHSRRSCMITTDYRVGERSFEGFILDISRTGAFIETDETFSTGQQIQLTFSLPNAMERIVVAGEILWHGKLGIGIQFKDLPRQHTELITAFMEAR